MTQKIIHIFDFDDTLVKNVPFTNFIEHLDNDQNIVIEKIVDNDIKEYLMEIKGIFWDLFSKNINFKKHDNDILITNANNNKPFDALYYNKLVENKKNARHFNLKNDKLLLNPHPKYHKNPQTLGTEINDVLVHDYKNAENKMILTGRDEQLRDSLINRLHDLKLPIPNFGVYMFPGRNESVKVWKGKTIAEVVNKYNFTEIHFYEDKIEWLQFAKEMVKQTFPNVLFFGHHITNLKD
jgi:hypothetical protein